MWSVTMLKYLQVLSFATHGNLLMHLIINTFLYECIEGLWLHSSL